MGEKQTLKYGRNPARYTPKSFMLSHILCDALAALGPPPSVSPDWVSPVMKQTKTWRMGLNDTYGDCVIADCLHQIMLRTSNVGKIFIPSDTDVMALYSRFQGYTGNFTDVNAMKEFLANNDNGCDELTVIDYLTKYGWLGHKLDGHANLNPANLDQIKWAICLFGGSRFGVNLPTSAPSQFEAGQPWDFDPNASLDGGHDVVAVKYDADNTFHIITWGQLWPVTPAFMAGKYSDGSMYIEEAHAEFGADWVNKAGTAPNKLDIQQLTEDLSAVINVS